MRFTKGKRIVGELINISPPSKYSQLVLRIKDRPLTIYLYLELISSQLLHIRRQVRRAEIASTHLIL